MTKTSLVALLAMLFSTIAQAEIKTVPVDYELDGTTFKGQVVWDDSKGDTLPGVLIVHEWWGANDYVQGRAKQIAELGYAAFVADMYGDGQTVDNADQAGKLAMPLLMDRKTARKRLDAALQAFIATGHVDKDKIAAMGYCFGGTMSLELARENGPVVGVISFHGNLAAQHGLEAHGEVKPSVVVMHGAADPMVPPDQVNAFSKEMDAAKADLTFIGFAGAEHAFTNPAADSHNIPGVKYQEEADKRSWQIMKIFLAEWLGE